ncbi:hypothetical protein EWM62_10520 [Mucilaginibacter terrigena]|uniref:EfeO-type cupredoxin-like domain-containing protein n=1 Tax=Mucilaginibacter terrigena TaxID=2492395 RepID=A0A4V1ZBQ4_9SPHI|nr:cupredoxin domain-containing protein [Mucilaginibacter terrigena]RYU89970.1 hypothetical protein EWM62_10520 [Mucilaginibacter terrigena]
MKKYILGISLMIAVIIIAVAACSKSDSNNTPPETPPTIPPVTNPTSAANVSIKDFAFGSASVTIKKGQAVTWTNQDSAPHTVTDNNGAFDSGTIAVNAKYTHTFPATGTFTYHCTFHSMMANATVIVTD